LAANRSIDRSQSARMVILRSEGIRLDTDMLII
jgi:hypothetical protein